jgi:hypothetical protein
MIFSEIMKTISYLFFAVIILYIYNQAVQSKHDWKKILGQGFLWCAGGAFVLALMLGRPTCVDREEDGRGGNCLEYADDGFDPTNEQYIAQFAFYFTLSFVPVLVAANNRRKEDAI